MSMNFDTGDANMSRDKTISVRNFEYADQKKFVAANTKSKVKIVDDRVWCQQIPSPIPAITTFILPRGWLETQEPSGAVPGQHGHRFHPKGNMKVLLRFWCSGVRMRPESTALMRRLLYEKGEIPPVNDVSLKWLVINAVCSKVHEITSAKVVSWNGRNVLECEYMSEASDEVAFDNTGVKMLKCWAIIYDNAHSNDPKVCDPLPASIEFITDEANFRTNLQSVKFAAKSILWNKE